MRVVRWQFVTSQHCGEVADSFCVNLELVGGLVSWVAYHYPAVFQDVFNVFLGPPSPWGSGGGSGLSCSFGDRVFGADSGPDPGGNDF